MLTPRQKAFCEEYIKDFNATAAYKRAGYTVKNDRVAKVNASRLLTDADVEKYIASLQQQRMQRVQISADRALLELSRIAFSNITDVISFNNDGISINDCRELEVDVTAAIANITRSESQGSKKITVKMHDKIKALTVLAQHLGLTGDFNCAIATLKRYGLIVWQDSDGWHIKDEQTDAL
ncbi:MAG: terminase small subunit [Xenococcaceae cyanobacterium]